MDNSAMDGTYGLGTMFGRVFEDVQDLVRAELRLARAELDEKLHRVIIAAVFLLGGALLAFAGLVVVLEGVAAVLALVLPVWAASLIVGVLIVTVGGSFAWLGLKQLSLKTLTPDRMTASLKKDVYVVKEHI